MTMNGTMAMPVNPGTLMAPVFNPNVKDSRWLTLEVCREFTRNKCTRSDQECKFAHPPPHVEVQNGRVTCCFDSIKGKCQRKDPPCKYLHPPQHLKEQLLQNGRNNLILKNLQMQALAVGGLPQVMPGLVPTVAYENTNNPKTAYSLNTAHVLGQYGQLVTPQYMMPQHPAQFPNPYVNSANMGLVQENSVPVSVSSGSPHQVHTNNQGLTQKVPRADRLESSPVLSASSGNGTWNGHPGHVSPTETVASSASQYNPIYFQGLNPGMMPMVKRPATVDGKSGIPMYQPLSGNAYQQALAAMQLQQQYVPVTIAGHPPGVPRF